MPKPLTIALDATPLAGPLGGIYRFTSQLLLSLRTEFPQDNYIPLSDQFAPTPKGLEKRWWLYGLNRAIRRTGSQVFHGTDFAVPYLSRCPSVMTVHDLSPWHEPSKASARVRSRAGLLLRLGIPSFVHTPSEVIRQELIARFGWPAERAITIPHAAAPLFAPSPNLNKEQPYFLYLGAMEPRKNLKVLAEAMQILSQHGFSCSLRLAGQCRPNYEIPIHPSIQYLGPQEEGQLPHLLSNAIAVLYPSTYEGFGLPILEAMQCGAPVITSDIPVLRETGGDAAFYANPADASAWAHHMMQLLTNSELRVQHSVKSTERAAQFSWAKTAKAFHQLYERCLSNT